MKDILEKAIGKVVSNLGIETGLVELDYPDNFVHGDYATNIALLSAKGLKTSPKALAEKIVASLAGNMPDFVDSVSVAGPGFINISIKDEFFGEKIIEIAKNDGQFGKSDNDKNKKILVEYTDPNTYKAFHIGHLMSNAIGESISRLIEYSGVSTVRLCYPSDIGLHIAKSIWAIQKNMSSMPADDAPIIERTTFLGKMYVEGTNAYEADTAVKDDIDALNQVIYEKKSLEINALYEKGRKWSLDHFELLYKTLGTKFDEYIFESEMAPVGLGIVKDFLAKGVFEESEGAVVFKGEKYGLHTRVFMNSHGLPTYEAKELGLNKTKFEKYPETTESIIITASEQNDYFKVLIKALTLIDENVGNKTKHIGHGMLRFASGKMSSRTGKVITAEALLAETKELVAEKMNGREFSAEEVEEISSTVAVAAIKYSILRSSIGGDVVYDQTKSISFEGDSGPYLQYSAVRANSILEKAKVDGVDTIPASFADTVPSVSPNRSTPLRLTPGSVGSESAIDILTRLIVRFPEIVEHARNEYAPQHIANYLINLAGAFNSFYASQTIVDKNDPKSPYYVAMTKAFLTTITNGLYLLGIKVPSKM